MARGNESITSTTGKDMMYIRRQFTTLKERILEPRKFMQVVAGPRQVGKSTLG